VLQHREYSFITKFLNEYYKPKTQYFSLNDLYVQTSPQVVENLGEFVFKILEENIKNKIVLKEENALITSISIERRYLDDGLVLAVGYWSKLNNSETKKYLEWKSKQKQKDQERLEKEKEKKMKEKELALLEKLSKKYKNETK
jgi:hypothetical protein